MSDTPIVPEAAEPEKIVDTANQTEPVSESAIEDQVLAEMSAKSEVKAEEKVETRSFGPPPPAKEVKPPSQVDSLKTPEEREEYFKALRNLRWVGIDRDVIESMPLDKMIQAGKNAAGKRSEHDRLRSQRGVKQDSRQPEGDSTPGNGQDNRGRPRPAPEPEYDDDLPSDSEPVDDLQDDLPDEPPVERGRKPRSAEVERLRSERDYAVAQRNAALMESAMRTVEADFPQVRNRAELSKIAKRMERLDPDGSDLQSGGDALVDLFKQACLIEYGNQLLHQARAATREASDAIRDGQPTPSARRDAPAKPPTEDELEDAVLNSLKSAGWNKDVANRELDRRLGR